MARKGHKAGRKAKLKMVHGAMHSLKHKGHKGKKHHKRHGGKRHKK